MNETEKAKAAQRHENTRMLAEILGQHSEDLLPLLEWVPELRSTLAAEPHLRDGVFDIVGRSRTNTTLVPIQALMARDKPFLLFDWKRNYRDLLAMPELRLGSTSPTPQPRRRSPRP